MYRPSYLLTRAGLDLTRVQEAVGLADLDLVPLRVLPERARPLLGRWVGAITFPWAVYVTVEVLTGDRRRLARLLVHELAHVAQWRALGVGGFLRRYLGDYLRARAGGSGHRQAYAAISLERQAEEATGRVFST